MLFAGGGSHARGSRGGGGMRYSGGLLKNLIEALKTGVMIGHFPQERRRPDE